MGQAQPLQALLEGYGDRWRETLAPHITHGDRWLVVRAPDRLLPRGHPSDPTPLPTWWVFRPASPSREARVYPSVSFAEPPTYDERQAASQTWAPYPGWSRCGWQWTGTFTYWSEAAAWAQSHGTLHDHDDEDDAELGDVLPVAGPAVSPDCAVGKHKACSGDAWDDERDAPTRCACTASTCMCGGGS